MDNELNKNLPQTQEKPEEELSGKFRQPRFGLRRTQDGSVKRVPILQHEGSSETIIELCEKE